MNQEKVNLWLTTHGMVQEEPFITALKRLVNDYLLRAKYQTHEHVYKELGICKQTLSYWAKNPDHTQTKKQLRYDTIVKCSRLFELTPKETELLANKAGLSITHFDSAKGFPSFDTQWILSSACSQKELALHTNITERMLGYILSGRHPSKSALLSLAISQGYSIDHIQLQMKKAGYVLSMSIPSDIVILYYLSHPPRANPLPLVWQINLILDELGLPMLGTNSH